MGRRWMRFGLALLVLGGLCEPCTADATDCSLYFGGPGGSVSVEDPTYLEGVECLTVSCWFRVVADVRSRVDLVTQWPTRSRDKDLGSFRLSIDRRGRTAFTMRNTRGKVLIAKATRAWKKDRWHHAAGTWDGTALRLVLDGLERATRQAEAFGAPAASDHPLTIGRLEAAGGKAPAGFEGFISDVAIWGVARSADSIAHGLGSDPRKDGAALLAYYPLREPLPTPSTRNAAEAGGAPARLPPTLARVGWCRVPTPFDDAPRKAAPVLFGYDLSAPGRGDASIDLHTGRTHQLVTDEKGKRIGLVWQDGRRKTIHVTWINRDFGGHETYPLQATDDALLAAATTDAKGHLYHFTVQAGRSKGPGLAGVLCRSNLDGTSATSKPVDCSRAGLNVWEFDRGWGASMRHASGVLGMVLSRRMHKGGDGLNHQAALALAFSAKELTLVRNLGQTSGHSMGHRLSVGSDGELLCVDLGDNYPRGVHLHRFSAQGRTSRVVFTFKTRHGTSPRGSAEVYEEISGGGSTFYKWSNDNATYTELGDVLEGRKTYSVIFSTDRSLEGKVLDNTRTFRGSGDPRDLAMLRVVKAFHRTPRRGCEVSDEILATNPKDAAVETGGYYDFAGRWSKQRVTGVIWLTRYGLNERAHTPRVAMLNDGSILILWVKATKERASLQAMRVSEEGEILDEPVEFPDDIRPTRHSRFVRFGSNLYFLAHDGTGKRLKLCFLRDP